MSGKSEASGGQDTPSPSDRYRRVSPCTAMALSLKKIDGDYRWEFARWVNLPCCCEDRADYQHHRCMGLRPGVVELAPLSPTAATLPPSFDLVRLLGRVLTTRLETAAL